MSVPAVIGLLAEPIRWRLARELADGDQRVRELVTAVGVPQNLVSYHLRQLRTAGLVTARRSTFDARDTYYSLDLAACAAALDATAAALHPGLALHPGPAPPGGGAAAWPAATAPRGVLFVCTGNSGRSPMAAALLRHRGGGRIRTASAGTHPKPLRPEAAAVLRDKYRIDIGGHRPTAMDAVAGQRFDYVISLCDKAREAVPEFAGAPRRIHWSLPDPTADAAGYQAFERTAAELDTRIRFLLPRLAA
jgi:ArsR family transcriptional regulator, arsenate/arsenite/antimonite-responsive transcriptional repressor / arsenate reductase (thioredoxin)